jgi:hypothetical protein
LDQQAAVSPDAIQQRMNTKARAFLQDMLRQALATVQALEHGCDAGLCTVCTKVYRADSTGFALPEALQQTLPGSGGRAAQAGAKIQAVWAYKQRVFGHCVLPPWNIPDQRYLDTVVAFAQTGILCIFALGYVQLKAFARLATAGAYFFSRLNQQTTLVTTTAGRWHPVELARWLTPGEGQLLERSLFLGDKERVAARLIASRVPDAIVHERRRHAKKQAKKTGSTPSQAPLTLMAWHLFITHVPHTIWKTETLGKVYPIRWQIALMCKSWKRSLP